MAERCTITHCWTKTKLRKLKWTFVNSRQPSYPYRLPNRHQMTSSSWLGYETYRGSPHKVVCLYYSTRSCDSKVEHVLASAIEAFKYSIFEFPIPRNGFLSPWASPTIISTSWIFICMKTFGTGHNGVDVGMEAIVDWCEGLTWRERPCQPVRIVV